MTAHTFAGDPACLHWNMVGLHALNRALELTPGRKAVVQAGGNLGIFAGVLAELFEAVYTFEPDPKLFPLLVQNAPAPNIIRFQAALGCDRKLVGVDIPTAPETHDGESFISGLGIIPTMRVDDLGLTALDLLYLDVEGYEMEALKGAHWMIRKFRPVIVCEINKCCERFGYTGDDLIAWLSGMGYDLAEKVQADRIFLPRERQ